MNKPAPLLHQRLRFDLEDGQVLDGPRRYLIMRPDVLMGVFDALDPPVRAQAMDALAASVTRFGGRSVQAYLEEVGAEALLQEMVRASASLGWGVWTFVHDADGLSLEVVNSPFAAGTTRGDAPVCHAIVGMLRAVVQALWSEPARVAELRCACQTPLRHGACLFRAQRQGAPVSG